MGIYLSINIDRYMPFGRKEFDQRLGHCQAVCEGPATCFTPEFLEAYSDSKGVLSNRDINARRHSLMNAVMKNIFTHKAIALDWLARMTRSPDRYRQAMFVRVFSDGYQGDRKRNCKKFYQDDYDMVRALVPPERLLEYLVEEGWVRCANSWRRNNRRLNFLTETPRRSSSGG
jgi:hypothetical protein